MRKYMWEGSYTVEAAFIVPVILGIMYAWMFQLFYLRDQVVMNGILEDMVVQTRMDGEAGKERDDAADRETMQSCLWLAQISSMKQTQNTLQTKYKIEASATWNIPVMKQFLGDHFHSTLTQRLDNVHPETVLRLTGETEDKT